MKRVLMAVSLLGLVVLLVLPALQFTGAASAELSRWGITIGTVLWFATTPFWMRSH